MSTNDAGRLKSDPDPRRALQESQAATDFTGFLVLAAQIGGLLFVFYSYHLETHDFLVMMAMAFGAFLIHYWIPFRLKEIFWVAVSIAGSFVLLSAGVATLVLASGLAIFLILRNPLPLRWRLVLLSAVFAVLIYECAANDFGFPHSFYAVLGGIFMFRIIIYVYDLAHAKEPPAFLSYLSYFFILPNYYFTLFPVIDYQTMRTGYYRRDIHQIAQQGIHWMVRGGVQLMLYRVVLYFNDPFLPDRVTTLPTLLLNIVLTFLLYLNVSGRFHIIVGMLHLFGYDLPETNHRYLLATGFLDFWRRINIYWKDFMVKIVYFPVYFKLRRRGELGAQIIATSAVFLFTWAAHSYQSLWIEGQFVLTWRDTIFWGILGVLVIANVLYDSRHKRRQLVSGWQTAALQVSHVLGTFSVITILWFLWSSPIALAWVYRTIH